MGKGIGGHHRAYRGESDEWLTPPEIIRALGEFDLDPCSPVERPWDTAKIHLTVNDDGLKQKWSGRVFMNPPYGPETGKWLAKLANHGNGIALIFARTETDMFHEQVWRRADAVFFFRKRLHFYDVKGSRARHNAGGPSALVAYGENNVEAINCSGLDGVIVTRWINFTTATASR